MTSYMVQIGLLWFNVEHPPIFQLYTDRTVVQFPNSDLLLGTYAMGSSGPSLPRHGPRTSEVRTSFISLASEGPHAVRVCRESNTGLPIHSPASLSLRQRGGRHYMECIERINGLKPACLLNSFIFFFKFAY